MGVNSTTKVYLGLGANLGNRAETIRKAIALLAEKGFVTKRQAGMYETPPWGVIEQPAFLNTVIEGEWADGAMQLLATMLEVEALLGRERLEKWGPRAIDIDMLSFGDAVIRMQRLTVPHPFAAQRAFVLVPWAEIVPDFVLPGQEAVQQTVAELLDKLPEADRLAVRRLD